MRYIFTLPLDVIVPRKKSHGRKYIINLNYYRNWHRMIENQVKKTYQAAIADQLKGIKLHGKIKLHFVMHRPNKRRVDRANVLCIHEKYFCDALVYNGCIPDDNDDHIAITIYETGAIDNKSPCVKVYVEDEF